MQRSVYGRLKRSAGQLNYLCRCMFVLMEIQLPRSFQEYKEGCKESGAWSKQKASSVSPPLGGGHSTGEIIIEEKNILHTGSMLEHAMFVQLHHHDTHNITFLAGGTLQFSPLVFLANYCHMGKRWVSDPQEQNKKQKKVWNINN